MLDAIATNCFNLKPDERKQISTGNLGVKMTTVNKALLNDQFRDVSWKAVNLKSDVPFPVLPQGIMYGDLCGLIHSPGLRKVFISDDIVPKSKLFFVATAEIMDKEIVVYSESAALAGENAAKARVNDPDAVI